MKAVVTVTKRLLSMWNTGVSLCNQNGIFSVFMWNQRQWKEGDAWFAWSPFCYSSFEVVVTVQCYAVKFHFLKLSIQVFCFLFPCCGL